MFLQFTVVRRACVFFGGPKGHTDLKSTILRIRDRFHENYLTSFWCDPFASTDALDRSRGKAPLQDPGALSEFYSQNPINAFDSSGGSAGETPAGFFDVWSGVLLRLR